MYVTEKQCRIIHNFKSMPIFYIFAIIYVSNYYILYTFWYEWNDCDDFIVTNF